MLHTEITVREMHYACINDIYFCSDDYEQSSFFGAFVSAAELFPNTHYAE
jgi:hypothetical protein